VAEKLGDVILNVAVGARYGLTQRRMIFFLSQVGDSTPQLFWTETWPGTPHTEAPYGFKIDAFDVAIKLGYQRALWLDSAVYPVKELDEVWSYIDQHGVLLLGDGWNVGQWTSDAALATYGVDRNDAMNMQLCYACVVGIDLASDVGMTFLSRWRELRDVGAFLGPWRNDAGEASRDSRCMGHRHDQSAASWLAHDMGIPMAHMPTFLAMETADGGDPVFRTGGL
jgi:hypothetical protein